MPAAEVSSPGDSAREFACEGRWKTSKNKQKQERTSLSLE